MKLRRRHEADGVRVRSQLGSLSKRATIRLAKASLPLVYRNSPVPLDVVLGLREFGNRPEIMTLRGALTRGESLQNDFLARHLAGTVLGHWTPTAKSLNLIERKIHDSRPMLVLEFGSGISTSCLAQYMREVHGLAGRPLVVTIEEDADRCAETYATAARLGLAEHISVVHAPLEWQMIDGRKTLCYQLPGGIRSLLVDPHPDFLFVDGPAPTSDPLSRFGTLPLVRKFVLPGSLFYLDDALRDKELEVGRLWSTVSDISVEGIFLVGHGLLTGQIGESDSWDNMPTC
jgi:predicted O-methyltransferase YrrM